jgi:hypothetical protein
MTRKWIGNNLFFLGFAMGYSITMILMGYRQELLYFYGVMIPLSTLVTVIRNDRKGSGS